jgi:retinol dehydrogenase 12
MTYDLSGKAVVITGATSGIGLAAVKQCVQSGAFVIGVGRSEVRNQNAMSQVSFGRPKGEARYLLADLAKKDQINALGSDIRRVLRNHGFSQLNALVNNAGVYLEKKQMTHEGIEKTFAVNHLAPFILTHSLLDLLKQAEQGRVLTVTSYSHRTTPLNLRRIHNPRPYIGLLAYKRSKLCNVLFSKMLIKKEKEVAAFAVDPGLVNTAIASKGSQGVSHWVWRKRRYKGTKPDVPARTILFLIGERQIDLQDGIYFKDSEPISPSHKAQNMHLAEKLWELSCELTGINW